MQHSWGWVTRPVGRTPAGEAQLLLTSTPARRRTVLVGKGSGRHVSHKSTYLNRGVWQRVHTENQIHGAKTELHEEEDFLRRDPWNGLPEERGELAPPSDFMSEPPRPSPHLLPNYPPENWRPGGRASQTAVRAHFPFCKLILLLSVAELCQGVDGNF